MTLDVAGLVEHVMKAWLLLYLCQDSIALREKYHSIGKILFFLQTFLVGYWISESVWVNRILYGNEEGMVRDSSYSIVKLAVLMCCSFLAMDLSTGAGSWRSCICCLSFMRCMRCPG